MVKLVIVESPAKAKTIQKLLGKDFEVLSSVGHIRMLSKDSSKIKDSNYGIDIKNGFYAYYEIDPAKKQVVQNLKSALKNADELYLATDGDREGESIAWHLLEVLRPKVPVKRMVFSEITKNAITQAKENTRKIDMNLVDAQEARRLLDRIYGFEVSPVLWTKIKSGLSAGRVQSPAVKLLVEKEKLRMLFREKSFYEIKVDLNKDNIDFSAKLTEYKGQKVAVSSDFENNGSLKEKYKDNIILDENLAENIKPKHLKIVLIKEKAYSQNPPAPFITSTLQQEASNKLSFSPAITMRAAQSLYENGYISYMRTDSPSLSPEAQQKALNIAQKTYNQSQKNIFKSKSKNAQEAHEAIRPSENFTHPSELIGKLSPQNLKLYELIYNRTIASQMPPCKGQTQTIVFEDENNNLYGASGTKITAPGFAAAYGKAINSDIFPALKEGDILEPLNIQKNLKTTQPPARYSQASLIKRLEELEIGRPSTYASIISLIGDRGYAKKQGLSLIPTWTAFFIENFLEKNFPDIVQYEFTKNLEENLDKIASGALKKTDFLHEFYFGNSSHIGLKQNVENINNNKQQFENIIKGKDNIDIYFGRYGAYLKRGDISKSIPDLIDPDKLDNLTADKLFELPKTLGQIDGKKLNAAIGRFGPYIKCGDKSVSIPKELDIFNLSFEQAKELLESKTISAEPIKDFNAKDPISQGNIFIKTGRYGPYITDGKTNASLGKKLNPDDITLDIAIDMLAKKRKAVPKNSPRAKSAKPASKQGK